MIARRLQNFLRKAGCWKYWLKLGKCVRRSWEFIAGKQKGRNGDMVTSALLTSHIPSPESLGAPIGAPMGSFSANTWGGVGNPMSKESNSAALVGSRSNLTADPWKGRKLEFFFWDLYQTAILISCGWARMPGFIRNFILLKFPRSQAKIKGASTKQGTTMSM